MKQQNFVTAAMQPVQHSIQSVDTVRTKRTFDLFGAVANLYTTYTEWTARRNRVKICRQVAELFRTDMESAGTLLYLFRDMTLWIDGDPNEERRKLFAYLAGETERPQIEQREPPVHPAWTKEQLAHRAPMIEDYDEFDAEQYNMPKLAQVDRPKTQPKATTHDTDLELAIDALIDYTQAAFAEGLTDSEGVLLKGNVAPWAKRGDLPPGPKAKANEINNRTNPKVWSLNSSKLWQLNRRTYANPQSAIIALQEAYQAHVGDVGDVDVGESDED